MNKLKINQSEKLITIDEISSFENKYSLKLPQNYKKLILKYNGGVESTGDSIVNELYSIKYGELLIEEAISALQIIEKNIPIDYLPFANTGTGNEITIFLKEGDDYGKIYLFRYDELEPRKIANSLEELFGVKNIEDI